MGIDSLCIKDMAGILSPISAERLVTALVKNLKVPIQLHSHATSGMAVATYVEGVRAGAGAIDCAISVMSGFSSQPPVETMLAIFDETSYKASLDIDCLRKMCRYFTELAPKRRLSHHPVNVIDPEILVHHIPGGMISNLRSQLQQQDALDRLEEVLQELPRARADLGYPPLVTPTSQIVGVQAVLNVLSGKRYSMVTEETRNYVRGLYGRSPAAIKPSVRKLILDKEKPITCRPADRLEPMLPKATMSVDPDLIHSEEDIIAFCLFPEPSLEFFKWRNLPMEERPSAPADLERRKEEQGDAPPPPPAPPARPFLAKTDYKEIEHLLDKVKTLDFSEVLIRRNDLTLSMRADGLRAAKTPAAASPAPAGEPVAVEPSAEPDKASSAAPEADVPEDQPAIRAPLNGTFYRTSGPGQPNLVEEGAVVKADTPLCIIEAMKLFNQIKAPSACRILKIVAEHGQNVQKGEALILIEET
jgi:oxaloacetate decarboxylase alpha subunit